jgi:uncharacterized membrane protein YedE/YeeE
MESNLLPLLGGVLIGLSSTTMLGGLGRITGISGILAISMGKFNLENIWRYNFLIGLLLGGFIMKVTMPELFNYEVSGGYIKIIIAGLLVGFGTRLGSGCTSGHGVCGLARLAKRSIVATLTFILFGMITVFIERLL